MENDENKSLNISLASLWKVFSKRFIILLVVGILCFAGLFVYSKVTHVPQFQSTGEMYMMLQAEDNNRVNGDYQISTLIGAEAARILKSDYVCGLVIQSLDLDWSVKELANRITVNVDDNSGFLKITVTSDGSPAKAQAIAKVVCRTGADALNQIWGENQATVLGEPSLQKNEINTPSPLMMALISLAVVILVYAVFLVLFLKNEHVGNGEDVERRLQLVVLGDIPDANKVKRYGPMRYLHKYGKYGKYGKYTAYSYGYGNHPEASQKAKKTSDKGGKSDQ